MSKIKILPEDLANKIAAGEVIERPASVVKEFVENGIDAQAHTITVEVEGGGTRLLRVVDDGEGMDGDDVLLCLERHATSKLKESTDLHAIRTLGFRGEAVPSIASVSRLAITSRKAEAELGTLAEVRYGQVRRIHEMGCSRGTIMEVRDLFGNVPARRKFLKGRRTELGHIEEVVVCAALAHPALAFRYLVDGREVLSFAEGNTLQQRLAAVLKQARPGGMVKVDRRRQGAAGEIDVHGWLLAPDAQVAQAAKLRLFVLGRPVRDRMISHAVSEGAHGYYLKGRRPAGVIMVSLPLEAVDVNVHPTKQEIRFHQANLVHQAVVAAVRHGLQGYQETVKEQLFGSAEARRLRSAPLATREPAPADKPVADRATRLFSVAAPRQMSPAARPHQVEPPQQTSGPESPRPETRPVDPPLPYSAPHDSSADFAHLSYIGQYDDSYLLCSSSTGLVVIDQHAAHERLLFERLKAQVHGRAVTSQVLLFPEMVECDTAQTQVLKTHVDEIAAMGLVVEEFGGETFVIKAVPSLLAHLGPQEIFKGIIDHYVAPDLAGSMATRLEDILATMACKAAVKANHTLLPQEGTALIEQMLAADVFSHCPHGRPVYRLFSPEDIRKWFKRT